MAFLSSYQKVTKSQTGLFNTGLSFHEIRLSEVTPMTIQSQPLYQQAFGTDFDLGIKLDASWEDISYSNDTCPSFKYQPAAYPQISFKLWIEHKDQAMREHDWHDRYS